MRNARMTVLMTADEKADIEAEAKRLGVSSGEYVRLAVDNCDRALAEEEAQLAALVAEVDKAVPKMAASLDQMIAALDATHAAVDRALRSAGIRA